LAGEQKSLPQNKPWGLKRITGVATPRISSLKDYSTASTTSDLIYLNVITDI